MVSGGMAPPSFLHLKNVERGGDPRRVICWSVERFHRSAIRKKACNSAGILVCPAPRYGTGSAFSHGIVLRSQFGLDGEFSPAIDCPELDSSRSLVQEPTTSRVPEYRSTWTTNCPSLPTKPSAVGVYQVVRSVPGDLGDAFPATRPIRQYLCRLMAGDPAARLILG